MGICWDRTVVLLVIFSALCLFQRYWIYFFGICKIYLWLNCFFIVNTSWSEKIEHCLTVLTATFSPNNEPIKINFFILSKIKSQVEQKNNVHMYIKLCTVQSIMYCLHSFLFHFFKYCATNLSEIIIIIFNYSSKPKNLAYINQRRKVKKTWIRY
jgi:hypothetical protein